LSDNICPFKIVMPTDPPVSLIPSLNTANLERIVFNIHNPILLRLLVCKEEKHTLNSISCPPLYDINKNSNAINISCNFPERLAHIYIRHEQINNIARSCVIIFIEAIYLFKREGLLNLFQNTVNWLNIAHERPYFFVLRFGKHNLNTNFTNRVLNVRLREIYSGYSKDEDICTIISVEKNAELLRIDHTGINKKFVINPK